MEFNSIQDVLQLQARIAAGEDVPIEDIRSALAFVRKARTSVVGNVASKRKPKRAVAKAPSLDDLLGGPDDD